MASTSVKVLHFDVSMASVEEHATRFIADAQAGRGNWICTLNLEMVGRALHEREYGDLMSEVDVFVADGASILLLAKMMNGRAPRGRSTGVDLAKRFLESPECERIGVIGGRQPEKAFGTLGIDCRRVCYLNSGHIALDPASLDRLVAEVAAAGCRLVLVALGVPKQDVVCAHFHRRLPHVVVIGVGGSLEILGGLKPRAPSWVQRLGFEWLFRLCLEPKRLAGRYLIFYPVTVMRLVRYAMMRSSSQNRAGTV